MLSWTVTGYINKTNVCLIMFDGNSMGSLRSDDGDGNENGKKAIDLAPLHMIPVDRAGPVSEISPYLKILRRIFDVFI